MTSESIHFFTFPIEVGFFSPTKLEKLRQLVETVFAKTWLASTPKFSNFPTTLALQAEIRST